MGTHKEKQIEYEEMQQEALEIAIEANVLKRCSNHEDCIFHGGEGIEAAYKLANSKWTFKNITGAFKSRREMTDCIKEVVEEYDLLNECIRCQKNFKE